MIEAEVTKYVEEIKIDYNEVIVHKEDKDNPLYDVFWSRNEFESLRLWPKITMVRDARNIDDYFKIELSWEVTPHNQVTISINDKKTYTFNQEFKEYKFISIDSQDAKVKWSDTLKFNVGVFAASDSGIVLLNRTKSINLFHSSITNNHTIRNNEILEFITLNQIVIFNHDPLNNNQEPKYNTVKLTPQIIKKQGLWQNIAKVVITNDDVEGHVYSNQIQNLTLSNLTFGDKTEKLLLRLQNNDNDEQIIHVDEVTKYDYARKATYKEPTASGEKGYYIPYSMSGEFFPILNISINNYFKDFSITIPYNFEKAFLDSNNGEVVMNTKDEDNKMDDNKKKDSVVVSDEDFNTIIKEDMTIEGIKNLEK